jgi:hypothetical protein
VDQQLGRRIAELHGGRLRAHRRPALANIGVASGAGLAHPGGATLVATGAAASTFVPSTVATGTWTFSLTGTALTWTPGTYTTTITYTATSV